WRNCRSRARPSLRRDRKRRHGPSWFATSPPRRLPRLERRPQPRLRLPPRRWSMTASRRRLVRVGLAGLSAASALWSASASCEPTTMEKADARAWMAEGRTLRNQRNYEAALKSFKAADGIMHVPTTGFEVARTL